jgi:hypothetical protein
VSSRQCPIGRLRHQALKHFRSHGPGRVQLLPDQRVHCRRVEPKGKSMSRNVPSVIGYILDTVFGLPGIVMVALLGSIAFGFTISRINITDISRPDVPPPGNSLTPRLVTRQGSSDAPVRPLVAAGRSRPGVAPTLLDPLLMVGHCADLTLFGWSPVYLAGVREDGTIVGQAYNGPDLIGTAEAKQVKPSVEQSTLSTGSCGTSVDRR